MLVGKIKWHLYDISINIINGNRFPRACYFRFGNVFDNFSRTGVHHKGAIGVFTVQ